MVRTGSTSAKRVRLSAGTDIGASTFISILLLITADAHSLRVNVPLQGLGLVNSPAEFLIS